MGAIEGWVEEEMSRRHMLDLAEFAMSAHFSDPIPPNIYIDVLFTLGHMAGFEVTPGQRNW